MQTHDYTDRTWGHDYTILEVFEEGHTIAVSGWGHGISPKDYLIMRNEVGTTRYQVQSIEYRNDPKDMWFAMLNFAPRG